jgi:hypothetical protein
VWAPAESLVAHALLAEVGLMLSMLLRETRRSGVDESKILYRNPIELSLLSEWGCSRDDEKAPRLLDHAQQRAVDTPHLPDNPRF